MNKTDFINSKARQAINRLQLPDYTGRYRRLRRIAKSTGRVQTADLWELESEMWVEDLLMLKL